MKTMETERDFITPFAITIIRMRYAVLSFYKIYFLRVLSTIRDVQN
jgi:hypothetical protein